MKSKNIFDSYMDLTDPREDNKRHLLVDIIVIVICASICSAGSFGGLRIPYIGVWIWHAGKMNAGSRRIILLKTLLFCVLLF